MNEEDVYTGNSKYFFTKDDIEGVDILEQEWRTIFEEFSNVFEDEGTLNCASPNPPYLSAPNVWKNVYFYNFMWKYHKNVQQYPKTYKILKKISFLTFAEVTILEPNSDILPHIGETNTTIRGHLGLSIPGKLPEAGIEVNGEARSWEDGKVILFSDAHRHRVWNHTSNRRMVLVFDIIKKEYQNKALWYCAQSLSTLVVKGIDSRIPIIKKLPKLMQWGFHYFFSACWYIYLPLQRRVTWLP
ncbi:MAG: aspartyl/asparaginyl beta-hydroxylase domain-containing protein [Chitinophagales bacterium]|nr:aspartyl/asparaginyl beta-hydroxylase domain-containing protein [Chitinophagales bacterium]